MKFTHNFGYIGIFLTSVFLQLSKPCPYMKCYSNLQRQSFVLLQLSAKAKGLDNSVLSRICNLKANLRWGVAGSSRARFFVCFVAPRSCRPVHQLRITEAMPLTSRDLCAFTPDIGIHHLELLCQEERWSGSTASAAVLDVSAPAYTNEMSSLLWHEGVAQMNKPLTMLSCTAQS